MNDYHLPTKPIHFAIVSFAGDPLEGVLARSYRIQMDLNLGIYGFESDTEAFNHLSVIRARIASLYEDHLDCSGAASVSFDYEIAAEAQSTLEATFHQ